MDCLDCVCERPCSKRFQPERARAIKMRNGKKPYLLLPIEMKVREFHAKLLLSCFAAQQGFRVILGEQNEILRNLELLPRGIYLNKSIAPEHYRIAQRNKSNGNCMASWCEEGLVFLDPETYLRERVSREVFKDLDVFFAWGEYQAKVIESKIEDNLGRITCSGNPRFDLLRHPYRNIFSAEADGISKEHGPFILVNTNFSRFNHFCGRDFVIENMKKQGKITSPREEAFVRKWSEYLGQMFSCFLDMIHEISSSFPGHRIVVRPHPAENQRTWEEKTSKLKNVKVIHEGSVIPWIIASDVMIHNGCTTGVEAYVLGEPVICYRPIRSEIFDSTLPNELSPQTSSTVELMQLIREAVDNPSGYVKRMKADPSSKSLAQKYISGLNGVSASEKIVHRLWQLAEGRQWATPNDAKTLMSGFRIQLYHHAVLLKSVLTRLTKGSSRVDRYVKHKFPGLEYDELMETANLYKEFTGQFHDIGIQKLGNMNHSFVLERVS